VAARRSVCVGVKLVWGGGSPDRQERGSGLRPMQAGTDASGRAAWNRWRKGGAGHGLWLPRLGPQRIQVAEVGVQGC
jgi:hypothetical protein